MGNGCEAMEAAGGRQSATGPGGHFAFPGLRTRAGI